MYLHMQKYTHTHTCTHTRTHLRKYDMHTDRVGDYIQTTVYIHGAMHIYNNTYKVQRQFYSLDSVGPIEHPNSIICYST